jgi:hypothetical protein
LFKILIVINISRVRESLSMTNEGEQVQAALSEVPQAAVLASLGCGNPTALAELSPGEKVLDLGSVGGIDVLLAARGSYLSPIW